MHSHRSPISRLDQIHQILDKAYQHHGGTLLVDGLSGMGKTYFLRQLAAEAHQHNHWSVTFVNADRIENGEPYSFIERFLAAGIAPDWEFEPDIQQKPIVVARDCIRRLMKTLPTQDSGHIIIIDDAQWIDPESIRVLRHMIPRFNRRKVLIACGARTPHGPSSLGQFLLDFSTGPQDKHIALEPLTADDIRGLAFARFGVSISTSNATKLQELSGGSFLGVDAIFNQVTEEEVEKLHTTWNIPIRNVDVKNPLLRQYADLSQAARLTAHIVCVAEHEISPEILRTALARLDIAAGTAEALRSGIIRESDFGRSIVPSHDLVAAAMRETVDPVFARRIHQVLADLTDGFRSIRHLLKGSETWRPQLKEQVATYLAQATDHLLYANASEILRMALKLVNQPAERQQLITELVLINIRAKTGYQCLDLLPEIEAMPHSILGEFMAVMLRVYLVEEQFPHQRVQAILAAPATTPDEMAIQAFLSFMMVMMTMRSPDRTGLLQLIPMAQQLLARGPDHPEELIDQRLSWMVTPQETTLLLECYKIVQWHLNGDIEATDQALPDLIQRVAILDDSPAKIDCLVPLAGAAMATGDAVLAQELAAKAVGLLERVPGDPWAAATPRIILAHCHILFGNYTSATRILDDLEEVSHEALDLESRLTAAALRAIIDVVTGGQHYEQYLSHATRSAELHWEHYGRDLNVMAQLEIARTQQDYTDVVASASRPELATFANTQRGYLTYKAHALISLKQLDKARALVNQLRSERGSTWFEYWGSLDWLEARIAGAFGDVENATAHFIAALAQRSFPLPHALTSVDYGELLLSSGQAQQAEAVLRKAVATLKAIGAQAYLASAQDLLHRAAQTTRDMTSQVLTTMTDREQEVAALLADGHSNRAIADRLVISESTARFHVSNILRKLQLNSRAEVPQFLQQLSPQETSGPSRKKNH